jgi:hypothetical protein
MKMIRMTEVCRFHAARKQAACEEGTVKKIERTRSGGTRMKERAPNSQRV